LNLQESILIAIGVVVLAIGAAMAFAKVRGVVGCNIYQGSMAVRDGALHCL